MQLPILVNNSTYGRMDVSRIIFEIFTMKRRNIVTFKAGINCSKFHVQVNSRTQQHGDW